MNKAYDVVVSGLVTIVVEADSEEEAINKVMAHSGENGFVQDIDSITSYIIHVDDDQNAVAIESDINDYVCEECANLEEEKSSV